MQASRLDWLPVFLTSPEGQQNPTIIHTSPKSNYTEADAVKTQALLLKAPGDHAAAAESSKSQASTHKRKIVILPRKLLF